MTGDTFEDIGFAKVDTGRELRQGLAEVVYGAGKTADEIVAIVARLKASTRRPVLVTRVDEAKARALLAAEPATHWDAKSRLAVVGDVPPPDGKGVIAVATGGTSDGAVAEEAARTAEALGNRVARIYDVGVAGIHRLLAHADELRRAEGHFSGSEFVRSVAGVDNVCERAAVLRSGGKLTETKYAQNGVTFALAEEQAYFDWSW